MSQIKVIPREEAERRKKLARLDEFKVKLKSEIDDINRRILGVKEHTRQRLDELLDEFDTLTAE